LNSAINAKAVRAVRLFLVISNLNGNIVFVSYINPPRFLFHLLGDILYHLKPLNQEVFYFLENSKSVLSVLEDHIRANTDPFMTMRH